MLLQQKQRHKDNADAGKVVPEMTNAFDAKAIAICGIGNNGILACHKIS